MKRIPALAAALALSAAPAAAQDVAAFSATVDSLRQAARIPGLAIAVVRDGRVVLARGYGFADVENRVPVTEHTPFNIASVTKSIAGVVALRLVDRGVLDLDRPMSSYRNWAEFCADAREGGPPIFFRDYPCDTQPFTLRQVMSMEVNGAAPGTRFWYNPISYSWASRPMMEVTGTQFSTLVAQEVFAPAGMTESARTYRDLPLPEATARALAKPYKVDSAGALVPGDVPGPQGDGAAGGVVSTAADLAKFDLALDDGRLLSAARREEMWRPGRAPDGTALPYGIGWFTKVIDGRRAVWHTGLWEGAYSALFLKLPDERTTLILLANSDALRWEHGLGEAVVERSPFAAAFFRAFPAR